MHPVIQVIGTRHVGLAWLVMLLAVACSGSSPSAAPTVRPTQAAASLAPGSPVATPTTAATPAAPTASPTSTAAGTATAGPSTPSTAPSTEPSASPTTAPTAGPTASSGPTGSPIVGGHGGTLSFATSTEIQYLDPALAYDTTSQPAARLMFETLVTYDSGTTLVPMLATEMPAVSPDGLVYTFKLRTGVPFVKGDGTVLHEMNADDVVFTLNRLLDPDLKPNPSPGASFFSVIAGAADVLAKKTKTASGIKALDPTTVEITLASADQTFLNVMATAFASIVPKDAAGTDATAFSANPVGTGPYLLQSYTKGTGAKFVRNPHYWQAGLPGPDGVDFRTGVAQDSAVQQVQLGKLDVMGDQIPTGSYTAIKDDPQWTSYLRSVDIVGTQFLSMDTSGDSPLAKVEVRRAIEYAIDKDNAVQVALGRGTVLHCIFPTNMPGFDPACKPYEYDVEKAKAMLADAGYPDGFKTTLYTDTTDPDPQVAEAIQQDLAAVGITAELVKQEFSTLLTTITTPHAAPLVYLGWLQDFPDPSDFIDPILSCATAVAGSFNLPQYCNKELDALEAKARSEPDREKRLAMYQDAQRIIMADAPWVPIDQPRWVTLAGPRTVGVALHPVWLYDLRNYSVNP